MALPFADFDVEAYAQDTSDHVTSYQSDRGAIVKTLVNAQPLEETPFIAPFVACPNATAKQAMQFADIHPGDVIMDLGCGNGQLMRAAVQHLLDIKCKMTPENSFVQSKVIGIELDPYLADHVRQLISSETDLQVWLALNGKLGLESKEDDSVVLDRCIQVRILEQDIFTVDLELWKPTVLVLYLLPEGLRRLQPQLMQWLITSDGRRLVTIDYAVPDWQPQSTEPLNSGTGTKHLYLYTRSDLHINR